MAPLLRPPARLWLWAALATLTAAACAPATRIKRSALTLSPSPPSSSGRSIGAGRVLLEGSLSPAVMDVEEELITDTGDPGLWVPTQQYGANIRLGLSDEVEIGFVGLWARYDNAVMSTPGVAPLGPRERDGWASGPTLTVTLPIGSSGLALGVVLEGYMVSVPYAEWKCEGCRGQYLYDPQDTRYRLMGEGRERFVFVNGALLGNWKAPELGLEIFAGGGLHSTLTNVGFDNEESDGSTLEKAAPVTMLMLGLAAEPVDHLRLSVTGYLPLSMTATDAHVFGPGLQLSLGLVL